MVDVVLKSRVAVFIPLGVSFTITLVPTKLVEFLKDAVGPLLTTGETETARLTLTKYVARLLRVIVEVALDPAGMPMLDGTAEIVKGATLAVTLVLCFSNLDTPAPPHPRTSTA